ncbi:MAG: carboxypeptidase M32 [Promethearchaeota archaeon]
MSIYDEIMAKYREVTLAQTIFHLINWDMDCYIPPKGYALRGEQLGFLSKMRQRLVSSPELGKLLKKAESESEFKKYDEIQRRNIHLLRREYDLMVKVPEELTVAIAKQRAKTDQTWKKAKANNDWKSFQPDLEELITLLWKYGEILMDVRNTPTVYDALIDQYEPLMTQDKIAKVFTKLRNDLIPLVDKYTKAAEHMDFSFMNRKVTVDQQRKISTALCNFVQYDTTSEQAGGRIDETEHPFTTGYYDDVRITTHYHEDKFAASFYSVLHESGHALYEQNYPPEGKFQPWGDAPSYGVHESQSRFVENMLGRSKEFITYFLPTLNKLTNNTFKDISADQMTKAVNKVERSKIRIEADEVTYSLHIIIRFEIEKDLFANKIGITDLPSVWNEKYKEYLGVVVKNDSEGVLQDTHWASGYHGYFPSYALGNVYGGQFLTTMEKTLPNWLDLVADGKFGPIKQWLVDNVHRKGDLYDPEDLLYRVTGEKLNARPFIQYLTGKYKRIFG